MSPPAAERHQETGRSAVALGVAAVLSWLVVDALVSPGLGLVLGVGFVLTVLWLALTIHHDDFFVVAVLPPLLLAGVLLLAALLSAGDLEGSSPLARTVGGLVDQRLALVGGWSGCLLLLLARRRAFTRSAKGPRLRTAAPAERRRTSPRRSSARQGSPLPR